MTLLLLLCLSVQGLAMDGNVRIYFDESCTQTTASLEPNGIVRGYVAAENKSYPADWRDRLVYTDSLQVLRISTEDPGIPYRTIGKRPLGTIVILAVGAGEIGFDADGLSCERSRIVINKILPMGSYLPAADVVIPGAERAMPEQMGFLIDQSGGRSLSLSYRDMGYFLYYAEACFEGTVVDVDVRCLRHMNVAEPVAIAILKTDRNHWGVDQEFVRIETNITGYPECLHYADDFHFPEKIEIGDQLLILGGFFRGSIRPRWVFTREAATGDYVPPADYSLMNVDLYGIIQHFRHRRAPSALSRRADLIVVADIRAKFSRNCCVGGNAQVIATVSGKPPTDDLILVRTSCPEMYSFGYWPNVFFNLLSGPSDYQGETCVLYLTRDSAHPGTYYLIDNNLGVKSLGRTIN